MWFTNNSKQKRIHSIMSAQTQQQLIKAFAISDSLEKLPSGKYLIYLKENLSPEDFVKSMEYISDFTLKAFLSVLSTQELEKLNQIASEGKDEELTNTVASIIAIDEKSRQASDNGLKFAVESIAQAKNINLA